VQPHQTIPRVNTDVCLSLTECDPKYRGKAETHKLKSTTYVIRATELKRGQRTYDSFFLIPTSFHLIILGVKCYCCMWLHKVTPLHSVQLPWTSDRPVEETSTCNNEQHLQQTDIHVPSGSRTHNSSKPASTGLRVKTHIQRSGAGRGGAGRPAVCVFLP
jgi:hypothetical protein